MSEKADILAAAVVPVIKAAIAPHLERMALLEQANKELQARVQELLGLRDRVVTVETKATQVPAAPDLTPILERLAAGEARHTELRDRMVTVETKAVVVPTDAGLSDLHDRVVNLEAKAAGPTVTDMALVDVRERLTAVQQRVQDDSLSKDLGVLRERVAVIETKGAMPGPPGKDGANGKDGSDGLGFEDLAVDFHGDRTLTLKFTRGLQTKSFPIELPFLRYQGVYTESKIYSAGDVVTWAGSTWTANEATSTKPGDGSRAWTLAVKRGRDGRDGKDAPGALPVVRT